MKISRFAEQCGAVIQPHPSRKELRRNSGLSCLIIKKAARRQPYDKNEKELCYLIFISNNISLSNPCVNSTI